jgi:hypothetical protein
MLYLLLLFAEGFWPNFSVWTSLKESIFQAFGKPESIAAGAVAQSLRVNSGRRQFQGKIKKDCCLIATWWY